MISPRPLQRRLGDYHLSCQSLLDDLREQLACRYPLQSSLSFVEIALLVGFLNKAHSIAPSSVGRGRRLARFASRHSLNRLESAIWRIASKERRSLSRTTASVTG